MWIFIFLLLSILLIRKNKFLRTYFHNSLFYIGLQLGWHIYTPVCDVCSRSAFRYFDIVLFDKYDGCIHGYRILHREYFCIPLKYIPVGYTLVYKVNGEVRDHLYLEGTPFQIDEGQLILYRKKRKGISFISEEVCRSNKWPIQN